MPPETESKLPEGDQPDIGKDSLRRRKGIGSRRRGGQPDSGYGNRGRQRRGGHSDASSRSGGGMRQRGDHPDSGGLYNPVGDSKERSPSELNDDEAEAAGLYNDDGSPQSGWRRKMFKKYWKRGAAAGAIGGMSIFTIVLFSSVAQGPLEFIHLAQLLEKFHFSSQEDAQDGRLQSIIRYINDPSKPERTRMGIVGNIAADHLETKLNETTGLKSEYNPDSGRFEGYSVIDSHTDFKGKTTDQIKRTLADNYGVDPSTVTEKDGKLIFNPDPGGLNTVKRYRAQTKFSRLLLEKVGYAKVSTHVGSRVLRKRAGWDFHPIRKLDAAIQAKAIESGKAGARALKEKLQKQFNSEEATYEATGNTERPGGKPQAQQTTDSNGKPTPNPQGQDAAQQAQDIQNHADQINPQDPTSSKSFTDYVNAKTAAGAAGFGVGLMCVVRNLSSSIDGQKETKVKAPMRRKTSKVFSIGSQGQSGQDIDTTSLGIYKDSWLDTKDKNGNVTSTWSQARSIQAGNDQPLNGPDLPKGLQVFTSGNPFDIFDNTPGLGPVCGALNSVFGQIFGIVTGPVSFVVSSVVLGQVIPALADWLSGSPVSPVASGADFGNIVNYGARLSANDQYASAGGVPLNSSQELALKQTNSTLDQKDFQSKSFAYRIFNPDDSRTLAAHLIDNQDLAVPQNMASIFTSFGSIFKSALKAPAMMLSGSAHAAAQTYDYHGLKAVGFSASELGDPRFANPFANACHVVGCPHAHPAAVRGIFDNSSKASKYTGRAKKCFGINITHDGGKWNIDSLTQAVNFQSKSYPEKDCESTSLEWLRVRFWLLDTSTMEGYACFANLDDQSCQDLGFSTSTPAPASPSAGGFTNPFPDGWTPGRLDMGYDGHFTNRIVSPCSGKMVYVNANTSHGSLGGWEGAFIAVKCSQKIPGFASDVFYFAEGLSPTVTQGQNVTAGQKIAVPGWTGYSEGPGGIEWGLGNPDNPATVTLAASGINGMTNCSAASKTMVLAFSRWVQQNLGVKPPSSTSDAGCA